MKPYIHAEMCAERWGGKIEDYLEINDFMDSTKGCIADNRHRALTHNSWFISAGGPLERIFGHNITNSDGKLVSVRDIGEYHILSDFGNRFIPTPQDYLENMEYKEWMNADIRKGGPSSFKKIMDKKRRVVSVD